MKENSKRVLNYLKTTGDRKVTAMDVADALGLEKRTVDSIFTNALQVKGYGIRTAEAVPGPDGKDVNVKFLSLTPAGMALDPDA